MTDTQIAGLFVVVAPAAGTLSLFFGELLGAILGAGTESE